MLAKFVVCGNNIGMTDVINDADQSAMSAEVRFENEDFTVSAVAVHGLTKVRRNNDAKTNFQVVEGNGVMYFPDIHQQLKLVPRINIGVCQGSRYQIKGELEMVAISRPPFDLNQEEVV